MIATHSCSIRLGRVAARKLTTNNIQRVPCALLGSFAPGSASLPSSPSRLCERRLHTYQPMDDLFQSSKDQGHVVIGQDFVGKKASIRRVFGPGANAQALLTCGGEELAQNASFDPNYEMSKDWIRSRAVGPAVLSSTLISGLVGALIEASFPQTVPQNASLSFLRPLIVGMEVAASIQVESISESKRDDKTTSGAANGSAEKGYEILLSTRVIRVQDDAVIAEGYSTVWIPGCL